MRDQLLNYSHQHLLAFLTLALLYCHSFNCAFVKSLQRSHRPCFFLLSFSNIILKNSLEVTKLIVELPCDTFLYFDSFSSQVSDFFGHNHHLVFQLFHLLQKSLIFKQFSLNFFTLRPNQSIYLLLKLLFFILKGFLH